MNRFNYIYRAERIFFMFMVFKKKQMILTALVVMLGVAGYLNYRYDKDNKAPSVKISEVAEPEVGETVMVNSSNVDNANGEEDFFSLQRIERNAARQKVKAELESVAQSQGVSQETAEEARRKISELALNEEKELTAENMLSAKGFEDTFVYITPDLVTVTVKRDALSKSDTAKIVDVIFELTRNNNIKIVEVE